MKKKGTTFLEIVIAITIFLIAILPITYLTLNSLRVLKRSSEIEEGARIATSVINYIKSRGYNNLLENPLTDASGTELSNFSGSYFLSYDNTEGAYVVSDTNGNIISTPGEDFETDFYGVNYNTTSTSPDAIFFIESLGIDLDEAVIDVVMEKSDLNLAQETSPSGTYVNLSYTNPIYNTSSSSVIIGSGGIIENPIIYGLVRVTYTSKSKPNKGDTESVEKEYEQTFVVVPLENY
ncbi:hypothetical protein PM10SUCC1_31860 [Propionigenium maris DSM 9537]|uniref:Uncharacterized protein n=1 Tax=Propionigenium maris DSM 9537 TaxID=1123000 RepID=A0A9W6GPT2_9FUSO|nr:hypothetical protein [Propionigenium maris]GLI57672.1 hypothetical protein PM10SUCC1_31860 [Propionigenium maris DSM 9537]